MKTQPFHAAVTHFSLVFALAVTSVACVTRVPLYGPVDASASPDGRGPDAFASPDVPPPIDGSPVMPSVRCGSDDASVDALPLAFGPTTTTNPTSAPPPIAGGTLLISRDQNTAIAGDPDHDVIWFIDVPSVSVRQQVALLHGDEPGRMAEDSTQIVHVVLRRGGVVADIDLVHGTVLARRPVCAAPRGIDYDPSTNTLFVACVDGTFAALPAASTGAPRYMALAGIDDLRDVVVDAGTHHVFVSRFRSAEVLEVDPVAGTIVNRTMIPNTAEGLQAGVAWRMIPGSSGGVTVLHQLAQTSPVCPSPGGYGGAAPMGRDTIVRPAESAVAPVSYGTPTATVDLGGVAMALVVDVALASVPGQAFAVAGAGAGNGLAPVMRLVAGSTVSTGGDTPTSGQAVSVAFTAAGALVVQSRNPAALYVENLSTATFTAIPFALPAVQDTGHDVFHTVTGGGLACAGCHPEGGDDGRVWSFAGIGPRRTQNLRGGVSARAPFHWDGQFPDMTSLLSDVYHGRMTGPALQPDQVNALTGWLDTIPNIPHAAPADTAAVARGQMIFNDPTVACTTCHSGTHFTNDAIVDVGTGAAFKVPSLVGLAFRAPYLHDGCALTLQGRFDSPSCAGAMHGNTATLNEDQITDLIAYLGTL